MQIGEYITHRLMVDIIKGICVERGLTFRSFSDDWVLELAKNGKTWWVIGYSFSLNNAASAGIAKDKVATHLLLDKAGVPSVPHALLRPTVSDAQKQAVEGWDKIVVKPLEGTSGRGVKLVNSADEAVRWVESTEIPAWAASPFMDITREIRFILLDQKPLVVFEKQAAMVEGLKMFNLGQGASSRSITPSAELLELAARGQAALGLRLSAVDLIETAAGDYQILEINSGFMMEHYMRASEANYQEGVRAYDTIIDTIIKE